MRRRGGRWGSRRGGGSRLLDRLRELQTLGLRDLRPIVLPAGAPDGIELAEGRRAGGAKVALVLSARDAADLVGWGAVALMLATGNQDEIWVVAPRLGERTRRAAEWASNRGRRHRLLSIPALAETSETLLEQEIFPRGLTICPRAGAQAPLLDRLISVITGATSVASCGDLRVQGDAFLLYMRGTCVARIFPEGDRAAVQFMFPDSRVVHVSEGNFARWGVDLHETVIGLAQDPRLLDADGARREQMLERVMADAGARLTSRWLVWGADPAEAVEWVGVDPDGRPVLGVIRTSLTLSNGPGLLAAMALFEHERARWAPGAAGPVRLRVTTDRIDPKLLSLLETAAIEIDESPARDGVGVSEFEKEPERRRGRRSRRRRRGRGEGTDAAVSSPESPASGEALQPAGTEIGESMEAGESFAEHSREVSGPRRGRSRRGSGRSRRRGPAEAQAEVGVEAGAPAEVADAPGQVGESAAGGETVPGERPLDGQAASGLESGIEEVPTEPVSGETPDRSDSDATQSPDLLQLEVEATLAEEPEEEAEPTIEMEPVRRRNPRVAIVVRNDPDSVLAALVLARDRRSIVSFRVIRQEGLMDFFRGPANDLAENVDLLLVGLTAQPTPYEVIQAAQLFRGRLEWFENHAWPIEDIERLRDAIGRESIVFDPDAVSSLTPVVQVTQRRSRFTDKLIDLAGRRLPENDMEKWGYRVVGLLHRLVEKEGEHRSEIAPILSGKPASLPESEGVYTQEHLWVREHAPRVVHFGEYQMVVLQVPPALDAEEVGRRSRLATGARLSLASRENDDMIALGCNEEKRHLNVLGLIERISVRVPWARVAPGGDRVARLRVPSLADHPDRIEMLVREIVRHRSILYG